jgi:signal transduction histidine kinase
MAGDEPVTPEILPRPRLLGVSVRAVMLALVAALSLRAAPAHDVLGWLALMAVAGVPTVLLPEHRVIGPLSRLAEVVTTCLAAAAVTHAAGRPAAGVGVAAIVLSYLWVPLVASALSRRRYETPLLLVAAAVVLAAVRIADPDLGRTGYTGSSVLWLVLASMAAAATAAVQHSLLAQRDSPQPYAEATRLLTQLRSVARQLPGATLDPGGLAEHLLDEVRAVVPATRAAVLSASGGGRLVVLAQMGADRVDWETGLDADSAIADAWASQQSQTAGRSQARSAVPPGVEVSALIVPLVAGVRTVGLIALETDVPGAYPPALVAQAAQVAAPAALRLEAALLFDEVRSLATSEERQRLAREIHDGVAQELVMVGYGIDNALATLPDVDATTEELRVLRSEVTRVITELRLSLFELRSEVDRYGGLATAIADYARTVGQSAGLRVHLSLDESTARLPAATEAELLRIAQEAITNARKHAGAENLWVACTIDPPFAEIEVSDDGHGMVDRPKEGRYGLAIMAERAERIRGRLEIRPRIPNGTTVAVVLGSAPRRGSV